MVVATGQTSIVSISLILITLPITCAYFSYDDCGIKCKNKTLPCNIFQTSDSFSVLCLDGDICEGQADEYTPCIFDDKATIGGQNIWPAFKQTKNRPKPKPKPEKAKSCMPWIVSSLVHGAISVITLLIFL